MRVAIILNPIAGVRNSLERTRRRAEHASDLLLAAGADPEILITAHAGHARELAAGAVERGARLVVAWGGDGTVNEVATALAFGPVPLGVIPAGSGNGLARHFDLPADPPAAIRRLLSGTDRVIDVGELNGRLFVNLAGLASTRTWPRASRRFTARAALSCGMPSSSFRSSGGIRAGDMRSRAMAIGRRPIARS